MKKQLSVVIMVIVVCILPFQSAQARTWFQIDKQSYLDEAKKKWKPNQPEPVHHAHALTSGKIVYFYDAWGGINIAPVGILSDGSNLYGPTSQNGREGEYMVEVLGDHSTTNDLVIRLITTKIGNENRFLKWAPPSESESNVLSDDIAPENSPMNRKAGKLDRAYEMKLEKFEPDGNRFRISFLQGDEDGRFRKKYYLHSERDASGVRSLGYTSAAANSGGSSNRAPANTGSRRYDFFFDIVSLAVTDTLQGKPKRTGEPEVVYSSKKLGSGRLKGAKYLAENPASESLLQVQAVVAKFIPQNTTSHEYHWEVGMTIETGISYGIGSVNMSVTASGGESRSTSDSTTSETQIPIPGTTIPPRHSKKMNADLEIEMLNTPWRARILRTIRTRTSDRDEEYEMDLIIEVISRTESVKVIGWGDPVSLN